VVSSGSRRSSAADSADAPPTLVGKANWLPAPDGGFALCLRTYVPTEALLNGSYKLPNVVRAL
jgi:hypothetical protein